MTAWRQIVGALECLAKNPLTDSERVRQGRNLQDGPVEFGQGQEFCPAHEFIIEVKNRLTARFPLRCRSF